jgi:signal transduction histidine kinase
MRSLIQELHPHNGSEEGLVPALRRLVVERKNTEDLTVELKVKGEHRLPANIEGELFRIAQEALNNIVKHAHADRAVITLDLEDPRRIFLGIEDTGIGFDLAQVKSLPGHLGLTSMQERVEALGGILAIDSQPGKGTRLAVNIELKQEVEHARG